MSTLILLAEQQKILNDLNLKLKECRLQILCLQNKHAREKATMTIEDRLKFNGIDLSEYSKINTEIEFNGWWCKYLKCFDEIYKKDGLYFGYQIGTDTLIFIHIINSFAGNINDVTYLRNGTIGMHNEQTLYIYTCGTTELTYHNKKWSNYTKN